MRWIYDLELEVDSDLGTEDRGSSSFRLAPTSPFFRLFYTVLRFFSFLFLFLPFSLSLLSRRHRCPFARVRRINR